jgi:hypothetical protein
MDFKTISKAAETMPLSDEYFQEASYYQYGASESNRANSIQKFVTVYKDLKFGWNYIQFLIRNNLQAPQFLMDNDVLYRAYKFEKYGEPDQEIMMAISFDHPSQQYFQTVIQSFLLCKEATYEAVAKKTDLPVNVLKCFAELFYNVMGRKDEHLWLASQVYPETRVVEMKDNYAKTASTADLLRRAGFNSGMEHVEFFSGLRSDILTTGDMANAASKLENALMINGYMLASGGFLNTSNTSGIHQARTLIAAEKQGGSESSGAEDHGLISMGDSLMNELSHYGSTIADERREARELLNDDAA